jgi:hypothetical protein
MCLCEVPAEQMLQHKSDRQWSAEGVKYEYPRCLPWYQCMHMRGLGAWRLWSAVVRSPSVTMLGLMGAGPARM